MIQPCDDPYCDSDPCKQMGKSWWRRLLERLGQGGGVAPSPEPAVMEAERETSWRRWKEDREKREEERQCTENIHG